MTRQQGVWLALWSGGVGVFALCATVPRLLHQPENHFAWIGGFAMAVAVFSYKLSQPGAPK